MRRIYHVFVLAFISVLFFQCQKELSYFGNPDPEVILPEPVTANLQGNVLDENGQPADNVTIKLGSQTATTDAKGYFRIKNASLDKKTTMLTAEKAGYFKSIRTFSATNGTNQVVMKMIKKGLTGTVNGTAGGEVALSNGSKVTLQPNGVVVASTGNVYTGSINVYAAYIDPTDADIAQTVPGSFMATNKDGKRVTLASYGMLAVELESPSGEKLQIKSGATAKLSAPIPSSLLASAPETIALWFVDEQTGLWKEEGSAVKTGNTYVGNVKHFSFWNYDIGIPAVNISMTLKNSHGNPLVHALVKVTRISQIPAFSYGWTDSLGQVSGLVPANANLLLEVLDPCNNALYSQNIGPYSQGTNIGTITVNNTGTALVTINGKLLNCTGNAVTNGFAIISFNNMVRYAAVDATGNFSTTLTRCSSSPTTFEIVGVDEGTQQQGTATSISVNTPVTDAGNISACGTSSAQFLNYTLDGVNYSINNATNDSLMAGTDNLQGTTLFSTYVMGAKMPNTFLDFNFEHGSAAPGTYPIKRLNVQSFNQTTLVQPFNVVITNYPQALGQFYEGNLSGQFRDHLNVVHNINASFRIRKTW